MTMNTFIKTHRRFWIPLLLGGGVIAVAVVLFTSTPSAAKPAVTWTPSFVTETVLAGDTITVPVSFTASRNLNNVVVHVVPELQPVVQVVPVAIGSVAKGETVNLNIMISTAPTTPPTTLDGTIRLINENGAQKSYAEPLPLTVNIEWQLFEEPEERYSLLYPPTVFVTFFDSENLLVLRRLDATEGGTEEPGIFVSVDPNPNGLPAEQYYDGDPGVDYMGQSGGEFSALTVDGIPAIKFVPFITLAGDVVVIVPLADEFIVIDDHGVTFQSDGVFTEILSSMEF